MKYIYSTSQMLKLSFVIRRVCGQTLGLGLVDRYRTVVIISLQQIESM